METPNAAGTPSDIDAFVRKAKGQGVSDEALIALLRHNGWSDRRVYRSLGTYYTDALGVAPPSRSGRREYARDAFLYLINFITLAMWTIAAGNILFQFVDHQFPDSSVYPTFTMNEIAWQLATIIIAFPVFLGVDRLLARELARRVDLYDSGVRTWLTYLALVIAAVVVLGDAIWFLESFLSGGLTVRFILQSAIVLVIGGGVFGYYLSGLRPPATIER